ncbi:hypothetical protein [Cupriavidus necator]|uniref:hypothetical protein n=1 Tax=Cupriavidus necator TaxID=106590 RepID=UPI0027840601|nr:hypothetical protein [Cupriavidus necator]MDQ0141343.1 hypothetical protein [Cupriavidus necator]
MRVVDHEPQLWFLFEIDDALYLDANCSHSFVGYNFMIRLSADELSEYRIQGRDYLTWLANEIHHSAPILSVSNSPYKTRKASVEHEAKASAAFGIWMAEQGRKAGA